MGSAAQAPIAPDSCAPGHEQPSAPGRRCSDQALRRAIGAMQLLVLSHGSTQQVLFLLDQGC